MEELLVVLLGLLVFFVILFIIVYVINGIVYTKLAKKTVMKDWGWAWVPYGSWYVGAKVGRLPKYIWIVPIALGLVGFFVEDVVGIGLLIGIGVYTIYNDRGIFKRFGKNGNTALLHLIPFVGSIIVYVMIAMLAFGREWPVPDAEVIPSL